MPLAATLRLTFVLLLALLAFISEAKAAQHLPGERPATAPQFAELEYVAQAYWGNRGITLPANPEVFTVPDEPDAAARGELGGTRVWVTEGFLPHHGLLAGGERYNLCILYLHERGHNAGFDHERFKIMYDAWSTNIPMCWKWAR